MELEGLNLLHYSPVNVDWGVLSPLSPVVLDQLLGLTSVEGEVGVLAPHCYVSDLPVGCLIAVGDQADHRCVASKIDDVVVVRGHTVLGEQGVQEWTKHTPLRAPHVESQHGRSVVAYSHYLGPAR